MKKSVYEKLGGLDTRFGKGTFEDTDYRRRAMEANLRIAKNHKGVIEHFGRRTFDKIDPNQWIHEKNKEIYKDKWGRID
jgi:GT2 family glycosyltransferase